MVPYPTAIAKEEQSTRVGPTDYLIEQSKEKNYGNALGDQISGAWFPPFLVSDGESIN